MSNKITRKTLNKSRNRWMTTAQICFNYETMQSASVVYALGPSLEEIHRNDDEALKESLKSGFRFFNTQPWMGNVILSSSLAIEEEGGRASIEAASAIRTSLMGPFAGLGDSLFFVLPKTVFGAIAAYMAIEGNPVGVGLCAIIGVVMVVIRYNLWNIGYKQGVKFITSSQSKLTSLTDAASVMGLIVVGALIASNVKLSTPISFTVGESVTAVQDVLNKILPNLLPVAATAITYWALGKKKMTSARIVWIIIAISIVAAYFKIFG